MFTDYLVHKLLSTQKFKKKMLLPLLTILYENSITFHTILTVVEFGTLD